MGLFEERVLLMDVGDGVWRAFGQPDIPFIPPPPDPGGEIDPRSLGRANTGWVGAGSPALTAISGSSFSASNIVYENRQFSGDAAFTGTNVTIRNCKIPGQLRLHGSNMLAEYNDMGGLIISGANNTRVTRSYTTGISGSDAVQVKGPDDGRPVPTDITIDRNYFGNAIIPAGAHYDGIQIRSCLRVYIDYNNFDGGTGPFNDRYNAALFVQNEPQPSREIVARNNYFRGIGYYTVRLHGESHRLENNIWGNKNLAGVSAMIGTTSPYLSRNNKWEDGTTAIPDNF